MFETAWLIHEALTAGGGLRYWDLIWAPPAGWRRARWCDQSASSGAAYTATSTTPSSTREVDRSAGCGRRRPRRRRQGSAFVSPDGKTLTVVLLNSDTVSTRSASGRAAAFGPARPTAARGRPSARRRWRRRREHGAMPAKSLATVVLAPSAAPRRRPRSEADAAVALVLRRGLEAEDLAHAADEREADAEVDAARAGGVGAGEPIEDAGEQLVGDGRAAVDDLEQRAPAPGARGDRSARGGVSGGVAEQIGDDDPELVGIGRDRRVVRNLVREAEPPVGGLGLERAPAVVDESAEVTLRVSTSICRASARGVSRFETSASVCVTSAVASGSPTGRRRRTAPAPPRPPASCAGRRAACAARG